MKIKYIGKSSYVGDNYTFVKGTPGYEEQEVDDKFGERVLKEHPDKFKLVRWQNVNQFIQDLKLTLKSPRHMLKDDINDGAAIFFPALEVSYRDTKKQMINKILKEA